MSDLSITASDASEDACRAVFNLLLDMHEEGRLLPLNPRKALREIWRISTEGVAWLVRDEDGRLVATAAFEHGSFWYTDEPMMVTRWCYVDPAHRGGDAMALILREVQGISSAADIPVIVDVFNPARARAPGLPRGAALAAARLGFVPKGALLKIDASAAETP